MAFNPEICRNESEVESKLIVQYLLPELGYTPDTWHQEVALGSIRLDFLAFAVQAMPFVISANSPLSVVMEAKHPKQNLNNHIPRLKHYLTKLNILYGLLTNGKQIRIYKRVDDFLELVFQCSGQEVESKINEIKFFIGREKLKEKQSLDDIIVQKTLKDTTDKSKRQKSMKTIAIYHNKGGVGKTTIAVNLAATLRKKGRRVLLIDIDSQANTSFATGLIKFQFEEEDDLKERNVSHLLESGDFNFIEDIARESHYFNNPEIRVIPSHINLIDKEYKLNTISSSKTRLISKLNKVEDCYDFVVIDTPPSRDLYAQVALLAADYLIIPSDLKPFANQGLPTVKQFVKDNNEYREFLGRNPLKIIGILASKISTNSKFLEHTFPKQRKIISERYEIPLMEAVIYERTALSQCMNQTITVEELEYPDPQSIVKYAEKGKNDAQKSAMEFDVLADEVLQSIGMN